MKKKKKKIFKIKKGLKYEPISSNVIVFGLSREDILNFYAVPLRILRKKFVSYTFGSTFFTMEVKNEISNNKKI